MPTVIHHRLLLLAACVLGASTLDAQPLFRNDAPLTVTLTTNLRDLTRQRDSTQLEWYGAEMTWTDADGTTGTIPVELRARGHFRRQTANCTFPPLFVRAEREVRDGSILQGNPRVKLVTPCRTNSKEYQQYIFTEYLTYRTYALIDSVHHRTRLARVTYVDSTGRMRPIEVTAFFLETAEEVADEHKLEFTEQTGVTWTYIPTPIIDRIALFQYWVANTDWSVAGLHNIVMLRSEPMVFRPVAYDFDWAGVVGTRYSKPNEMLGLRSTRERLHRGPCRTAEQWAPTIALFRERRAAFDALWTAPIEGYDVREQTRAKQYLDELWNVLDSERLFKREIIDKCQPEGN